ncbi:4-hydroxythreonine-4-phosphate dehydrogenase PdxA [Candidatus Puniceispirillum sp.]|uniref:4-hydroxythreonine-4-phosphate dehydrogenase PdxA n=1 Tax=Candidatus Puniceispirillum sp. TaxID=2026719 RepID=UPI003F6A0298
MAQKPIIVTPGDPAGIGAEIALKAWQNGCNDFVILDDVPRLETLARTLGIEIPIISISQFDAFNPDCGALQVMPVSWTVSPQAGKPDIANAPVIIQAIKDAVAYVQAGQAAAMVTNPIAKATLYEAGFTYPGHTEFLGSLSSLDKGAPLMMLACDQLRVIPLTIHIPLTAVAPTITSAMIIDACRLIAKSLHRFEGIKDPHIAVCGLNPHAGEQGSIGQEDEKIIAPAIAKLRAENINVTGPHSADTLFHAEARATYDAVLGMYHDQVLIPIKTIDFYGGVNITLGLDFIRTSPDHGTGFDIAGKGIARPDSLIAALKRARHMASSQATNNAR